jgi:hypothetical protein
LREVACENYGGPSIITPGFTTANSHSDNKNRRFTRKAPVPDWDHERLFDRPGHIGGGGGGPFAESFF